MKLSGNKAAGLSCSPYYIVDEQFGTYRSF